ncbi:hypothetical protein ACP4OV_020244 [Aristida adscensionis]
MPRLSSPPLVSSRAATETPQRRRCSGEAAAPRSAAAGRGVRAAVLSASRQLQRGAALHGVR